MIALYDALVGGATVRVDVFAEALGASTRQIQRDLSALKARLGDRLEQRPDGGWHIPRERKRRHDRRLALAQVLALELGARLSAFLFSQKPYDGESYRRWMRSPRSPFRTDAWSEVASSRHNQLWRNHLLAIAARDLPGSRYAAVRSMAILHPGDEEGARVVASYRDLLTSDDDTFVARTLDEVVSAFTTVANADDMPWLEAFRRRYLALELSEDVWRARGRA